MTYRNIASREEVLGAWKRSLEGARIAGKFPEGDHDSARHYIREAYPQTNDKLLREFFEAILSDNVDLAWTVRDNILRAESIPA